MAYIVTLIISLTDWVVSLSFFCTEVRSACCRNCATCVGIEARRRSRRGMHRGACVMPWRTQGRGEMGHDGSNLLLLACSHH